MSTDRSEYIKGLRAIADALEADADLPLPFDGNTSEASIFCETKEEVQAWARVLTGEKRKEIREDSKDYGFHLCGRVHGYSVRVLVQRDEVCRRVVKGTRTEVRVEDIIQVVGQRSVPVEIEDVEWVCEPLLSEVAS